MKRFIGWFLVLFGGVATAWGGVSVLTGSSQSRIYFDPTTSVNALVAGLVGLGVLTVGLLWVRD